MPPPNRTDETLSPYRPGGLKPTTGQPVHLQDAGSLGESPALVRRSGRVLLQTVDTLQRALLVEYDPQRMTALEAVDDLNRALAEGWQVLCSHPMGGTAGKPEHPRYVSLVILTREIKDTS
jgi:hypothetical protein